MSISAAVPCRFFNIFNALRCAGFLSFFLLFCLVSWVGQLLDVYSDPQERCTPNQKHLGQVGWIIRNSKADKSGNRHTIGCIFTNNITKHTWVCTVYYFDQIGKKFYDGLIFWSEFWYLVTWHHFYNNLDDGPNCWLYV